MKVEVKETQSNEVDWTKNPQLVVDDNGGVVMVTVSDNSIGTRFSGVIVLPVKGHDSL